jgi:hypothetical protein
MMAALPQSSVVGITVPPWSIDKVATPRNTKGKDVRHSSEVPTAKQKSALPQSASPPLFLY